MNGYTPTTDHIRSAWVEYREFETSPQERVAEFDRWFQSEIEKAARMGAEEALRIVKEEWYPDE